MDDGLKRTVMVVLCPALRLYELLPTMLKLVAEIDAEPLSVPPPVFLTVKLWSRVYPMVTSPKARAEGVTEISGSGSFTGATPMPVTLRLAPPPPEKDMEPL